MLSGNLTDEQYHCFMPAGKESPWSSFSIACVFTVSRYSDFLIFFSFWNWEYLNLGMWLKDNTAQNTEACKTFCIWSSLKIFVRGLRFGKKQKRTHPLKVTLVTDWQILKGCLYVSPLQVMCEIDSWDAVAEVFLKAWPESLNRAVQHCSVCISILWSKITCAWHSSADCHLPWPLRFSVGNNCLGTLV